MKTEKTTLTNKIFTSFMCIALVSGLMVPGFAYATQTSGNEQQAIEGSLNSGDPKPDEGAVFDRDAAVDKDDDLASPSEEAAGSLSLAANTTTVKNIAADTREVAKVGALEADGADTSWYAEGQSSFSISTLEQLKGLATLVNAGNTFACKTINLTSSINLGGTEWTPIGVGSRSGSGFVGTPFSGTFNGKSNTISGLTITTSPSKDYSVGLFGGVVGGTVQNLTLAGVNIDVPSSELASAAIGMLTDNGTASFVSVSSGVVNAKRGNGAIVGRLTLSGTISNCSNSATVSGSGANVGGIVGAAYYTSTGQVMTISNCANYGSINGASGCTSLGGIAGFSTANISSCTNSGSVSGPASSAAGGITGEQRHFGTVSNNVNNATISGSLAGGIIGWLRYSDYNASDYSQSGVIQVLNNTNTANISGVKGSLNANGGIVGMIYNYAEVHGNINSAPTISGSNFVAGIVGGIQVESSSKIFGTPNVNISENQSSTARAKLSGACVDLYAYNNDPSVFTVSNNDTVAVATVGNEKFDTIQGAIDSITKAATPSTPTNYVIEVAAGTYSESLGIIQQANKNVTLKPAEGANVTFTESIKLDGAGRYYDAETLTIKGIVFDFSAKTTAVDCIITSNTLVSGSHYSYVHNFTIENCTFIGNNQPATNSIVGFRVQSGTTGQGKNFAIIGCKTQNGMHSLAQFVGGTSGDLTFKTNRLTDTEGGFNIAGANQNIVFEDNIVDVTGYALRLGQKENGKPSSASTLTIKDSTLSSHDSQTGTIVFRDAPAKNINITNSTIVNYADGGPVMQNLVKGSNSEFLFSLSSDYWGEQGLIASRLSEIDPATVFTQNNSYLTHITLDANGGTFAKGNLTATENATVKFDENQKASSNIASLSQPTNASKTFAGWSQSIDGAVLSSDDLSKITSDATLYAQWIKPVATVNGVVFGSIQAAIDSVTAATPSASTDYVIEVVEGIYSEKLHIYQQANKNVTIKAAPGAKVIFTDTFSIDGSGRYDATEAFTLEGITFDLGEKAQAADCIIVTNSICPDENLYSFAHNVTISNCVFVGNDNSTSAPITGIRIPLAKDGGQGRNISVVGCETQNGMFSLVQSPGSVTGTVNLSLNKVKGVIEAFSFTGTTQTVVFSDNTVVAQNYALRLGADRASAPDETASLTIAGSNLTNDSASNGTIVFGSAPPQSISITNSVIVNQNDNGAVLQNMVADNKSKFKFSLQDDYWGNQGLVESKVSGIDTSTLFIPSNSYLIRVAFDANGGAFADGSLSQENTAVVGFAADKTTIGKVTLPQSISKSNDNFLGWFTAQENGTQIFSENRGLTNDVTLYALWGTPEQEVSVVEKKVEETIAQYADVEEITPEAEVAICQAIEAVQSSTIETQQALDPQEAISLEALYLKTERVEATKAPISEEVKEVTSVVVEGAAVSVPLSDQALHAVLAVDPVVEMPTVVPKTVVVPTNALVFDITLSIANQAGDIIEKDIQPKAPLTITIQVEDPDQNLDADKLRIIHYHEGNDPEIIVPLSAVRAEDSLTIVFTLKSLSSIVLAQQASGGDPTPVDPGGIIPDPGQKGEETGEKTPGNNAAGGASNTAPGSSNSNNTTSNGSAGSGSNQASDGIADSATDTAIAEALSGLPGGTWLLELQEGLFRGAPLTVVLFVAAVSGTLVALAAAGVAVGTVYLVRRKRNPYGL